MDELSIVTLAAAKKYTDEHGGGGGGTSNYNQLENKPQIGGVTLTGNKSASELGLASATALANKVDKVDGKGLSTNDYTDTDKAIVDGVTAALTGKQDALTAEQYIDIDNDEISVKRDIARDVDAIIATSFDFPNCTITKTIDEEVVDTVTINMFGDIPSSVMDVYSVSYNGQAVVLTFTNTVASKEHAVGYTFQVASYSSGVIDTQTFVETVDADKKLIIQSELDAALAGKVDKETGKGLSKNDYTDADKAKVDASKNEFIGTMAEWEALTTAEKKAYDTYQFTDDYSEALLPNYSTTEQKTGQKWIDGKDIYFRTFTGLSIESNTAWITTNIDISYVDTIVNGVAIDNAGQVITNSFGGTNNGLLLLRSLFAGNTIAIVTIYYTKKA